MTIALIPVVSSTGTPLMPCHPARARKLVSRGKAILRHRKGFLYLQLLYRADGDVQEVAVGVDPGSKMEAVTVLSAKHTFLNLQFNARDGKGIQRALKTRTGARRARRQRHTPYRACRPNRARSKDWVPPSTRARWQWKLNILIALRRLYPISMAVVEDVSAELKKDEKRRASSFSPIQVGKNWFYRQLDEIGLPYTLKKGMETYQMRRALGLEKTKHKLLFVFEAHCVDTWVLANSHVGGLNYPENKDVARLRPLYYSRRQLHVFNPGKNGFRRKVGGTMSNHLKKGTLCIHPKYSKCVLGGHSDKSGHSLHSVLSHTRLTQTAKASELRLIAHSPWVLIPAYLPLPYKERKVRRKQARAHLRHLL